MRFSAASLEMQRTLFAVRDALPAVRGPRSAPPKASSASTRQNDACSRCRIRRKHILWVEGGRECSSLSALELRDGPWGSQVGLTSLPKAAPSLAGNVFRCISWQACELRGGRVKTRERARPRKETCRPRHTCVAPTVTRVQLLFHAQRVHDYIGMIRTWLYRSYARIKVAWINIYKCELWYYVLLSPLNILRRYILSPLISAYLVYGGFCGLLTQETKILINLINSIVQINLIEIQNLGRGTPVTKSHLVPHSTPTFLELCYDKPSQSKEN